MTSSGSESDFEDPDNLEVPGGGKDLASINSAGNSCDIKTVYDHSYSRKRLFEESTNKFKRMESHLGSIHKALIRPKYIPAQLVHSRMANVTFPQVPLVMNPTPQMTNEQENNEEEGMGVAETYANYMPMKLKIGCKHPDPVVESTSLSSVEPVGVWYELSIPHQVISTGALSALQLESITYACQQHERKLPNGSRSGFLIGDGAGVGKGRTIAGIIYENYILKRKKSLWITIISDLKFDAERDLNDIGASKIRVYSLNKTKYSKLSSTEKIKKGVLFCTYNGIIARTNNGADFDTRLDQIVDWCGTDFNGALIFDECHKAKNLSMNGTGKSTKTGQVVLELQKRLPNARIVYASATGATEPKDMAYMVRLGLWGEETPFKDFSEFLYVVQKRGVGAMEIVAMDMKLRGLYIARHLSFHGVIFKITDVNLTEDFKLVYDDSARLWAEAHEKFVKAMQLLNLEKQVSSLVLGQFWGAHQRFFKYMCISAKVKRAVSISREAIKCGKCVVIGLQTTGEARTLEQIDKNDNELSDFVSTAYGVFKTLIDKHFPKPPTSIPVDTKSMPEQEMSKKRNKIKPARKRQRFVWGIPLSDSSGSDYDSTDSDSDEPWMEHYGFYQTHDALKITQLSMLKEDLLIKVEKLGKKLPPNALDELIDELGGPENVAEMTGRKGRVVQKDGSYKYASRSEAESSLKVMNLVEKQRFMDGEKDVAIISEAASSGISLHSDRRVLNKKCRVHITLELPWSADKAIQQFGRTHRSNQVNAPEYILLISDLGGERRFASVVAKRLESLGALTQGDRRATEARDLSKFNIDNSYGRSAVDITLKSFLPTAEGEQLVPPPSSYKGNFMRDAEMGLKKVGLISDVYYDSDKKSLGKFLNRILGLPVNLQNAIFEYFTATMEAVIEKAMKNGHFDVGILDVATSDQKLKRLSVQKFIRTHISGPSTTELHRVSAERGMSWNETVSVYKKNESSSNFYVSPLKNGKREVVLAVLEESVKKDVDNYIIFRPNVGRQVKKERLTSITRKYQMTQLSEAKAHWEDRFETSSEICSHKYWGDICKGNLLGDHCDVGLRRRIYNILSGSVLSIWDIVENIISKTTVIQMVRVQTDRGKIVGTLVPPSCVAPLIAALEPRAEKVTKQNF